MSLVELKLYLTLPNIYRTALRVPLTRLARPPVKPVRLLAKQPVDSRQISQSFKARKSTKRARFWTRRVSPLASLLKVRTSKSVQVRSLTRRVLS